MRKRSALAMAVLVGVLILASATPTSAAPSLRLYRGETSQGDRIRIKVAKLDDGRYVQEVYVSLVSLTCPDETTLEFGFGYGFARRMVPIIDRAFSFDDVFWESAFHISGELGRLQGEGTLSRAYAIITADEQGAQLCTSGDLTWTVEFVRTL